MPVVTMESFHDDEMVEQDDEDDGTCVTQAVCGFWCASCRFCCRRLPPMRESVSARVMYTLFLALTTLASVVLLSPHFKDFLLETQICADETSEESVTYCQQILSYLGVYRLCLTLSAIHLLSSVFMLGVSTSASWRAGLHNGFWLTKLLILIGLSLGSFWIPSQEFRSAQNIIMYTAFVGAFLFIIIQLIVLVDVMHHTLHKILKHISLGSKCLWKSTLTLLPILMYISLIGAHGFMIYRYVLGQSGCKINPIVVGVNLFICVLLTGITLIPSLPVRPEGQMWGRLSQCGAILLYITFLSFNALSSQPPRSVTKILCGNESLMKGWVEEVVPYGSLALALALTLYSSFRTSKSGEHLGIDANQPHKTGWKRLWDCSGAGSVRGGQRIIRDELDGVQYSYSFFHFFYALAAMYLMLELTSWYRPEHATVGKGVGDWAGVWVRIVSAWLCSIVYLLFKFVPCFAYIHKTHKNKLEKILRTVFVLFSTANPYSFGVCFVLQSLWRPATSVICYFKNFGVIPTVLR